MTCQRVGRHMTLSGVTRSFLGTGPHLDTETRWPWKFDREAGQVWPGNLPGVARSN